MVLRKTATADSRIVREVLYVCPSHRHVHAFEYSHRSDFSAIESYVTELQHEGDRVALTQKAITYFGKHLLVVSRLGRFLKNVLWFLFQIEKKKFGDPSKVLIFNGELFLSASEWWPAMVREISQSLNGYYALLAVVYLKSEVREQRRKAYEAGIQVVLPVEFVPADMDDQALLVRSVEENALAERRERRWGKLCAAAKGSVFAMLLLAIGVVAKDFTANIRNLDSNWSCHLTRGGTSRQAGDSERDWEQFTLVISNDGGFPKQGFSIKPQAGCKTRSLPEKVSRRLKVGETVEVRFFVEASAVEHTDKFSVDVYGPWKKFPCPLQSNRSLLPGLPQPPPTPVAGTKSP